MAELEGKVVIVTGAGRGIGQAVAKRFARDGARLVLCDLGCDLEGEGADPELVRTAVTAIRRDGGEAVGDAGDVADPATPDRLVELARGTYGRLDCLVSAAGIRRDRSLRKTETADVRRTLDVHVVGTLGLLRATAGAMVAQGGGGSIVLMTGPGAFFGAARQALSAASHAAVAAMARSVAVELRRHHVRVNAVAPTARTRLTADLPLFQGISEGSMGPEHVAPVAVYLASDRSADVTGEVLGVAGGRVYAFRSRETTGALVEEGPMQPEVVARLFAEITAGS
jgi:NAD(P)-dependent dehydrogenase (short-subunit alcohol dehydrogenase family)